MSRPLLDQFVFGPGHVDTVRRGARSFVIRGGMRRRVSVVDQLGLNGTWMIERQFLAMLHPVLLNYIQFLAI